MITSIPSVVAFAILLPHLATAQNFSTCAANVLDDGNDVTLGCAHPFAIDSVVSAYVFMADIPPQAMHPFCEELPSGLLRMVSEDPAGSIASQYRAYIEHDFLPCVRRISDVILAHSSVIEMLPKEYLRQTFPKVNWDMMRFDEFSQHWLSYVRQWAPVLALWAAEARHGTASTLGHFCNINALPL